MLNRINLYIFIQLIKSCSLIFFIFLSITWLLQLTRLFTLTNLLQIDILEIVFLSFLLIPNLITIIIPFIIIFGILLCFLKLYKDREIVAIYSLGLELKPIKISLIFFSLILLFVYSFLNFYISPKFYEKYKLKEYELRNSINFDKIILSNFLQLNEDTTIDFKRNNNDFEDIFINFIDDKENIIFAKKGIIQNKIDEHIFQLNDGYKISISDNEFEKLEFQNYILKIKNKNTLEFNNFDKNTLTIFDDIRTKNYLNLTFKFSDLIFSILIIYLFYQNNILGINFNLKNNIFFICITVFILLLNQFLKNSEISLIFYNITIFLIIISSIMLFRYYKYE